MIPRRLRSLTVASALLALHATVCAAQQGPGAYLERGIASYQALELDAAAGWFRRVVRAPLVNDLTPTARDGVRRLPVRQGTAQSLDLRQWFVRR